MNKLKISLSAFAVIAFGGFAIAQQGLWPNFPIVGGASYSCGSVNGVSNCTVAAGPTVITGNETIPANTNLSQGQSPQNVLLKPVNLGAGPTSYQAITAGSAFYTYTVPNTTRRVIFTASGTISDERVTAPAAPIDNQLVAVCSTNTITAFQYIANTGQSLAVTTPTVITASTTVPQCYEWTYRLSNTTWYRVQ